jgi:hypothetical protein
MVATTLALATSLASGFATASAAAPALIAGSYVFTASGDLCDNKSNFIQNLNNRAVLYYAGPGKTGSSLTTGYTQGFNGESTSTLYALALPKAPASGPVSWTGSYTGRSMSNSSTNGVIGTPALHNLSGTITLNLTALSATSFYGTLTISPSTGDGCTLLVGSGQ